MLNGTWPEGAEIPAALTQAQATEPYPIDVLSCLVFAALWMRPPVTYGFSLSDCWAWLRYFPAIAASPALRLRDEWTQLDPHQKTVLSGDFGVGFTTWFLHQTLGLERYADTLWVVNTQHPGVFELGRSTKRGPQKSPDYIAEDVAGNFSVLECKGTQTSHASLLDAIDRGIPQKANLRTIGATQIQHSLVAGLFIPQAASADTATLALADPDWVSVKEQLSQFTRDQLGRGVTQIAVAKELSMLDLPQTANALARAKGSANSVTAAFAEDVRVPTADRHIIGDEVHLHREHVWPTAARVAEQLSIIGVRFEATLPSIEVARLQTVASPDEYGEQQRQASVNLRWHVTTDDTSVELRSPLGSRFRLSLLEP